MKEQIKRTKNLYSKLSLYSLFIIHCSLLIACNDPIFYEISMQVKIPPPIIKGSPTAFAEHKWSSGAHSGKQYVYTASGSTIYYFDVNKKDESPSSAWEQFNPGLGRIISLAGASGGLYALTTHGAHCIDGNHAVASSINDTSFWNLTMFAANDNVFIGRRSGETYSIYRINSGSLTEIAMNFPAGSKPLLNGVVHAGGTNYFFSVDDKGSSIGGIFYGNTSGASLIGNYDTPFLGIINTGKVYAIAQNGNLYLVESGVITETGKSLGGNLQSTGALSVWTDPGNASNKLLLAGRKDTNAPYNFSTGFSYGYMEAEINASGEITGNFQNPGNISNSTVADPERFSSTLGKYPINYIHQVKKDAEFTDLIFASTELYGVWSLRNRGNGIYWNTEN